MTVQPKHHWQFAERQGTQTTDTVSGDRASLSKAELKGHGRIGNAVHLSGKSGHVGLGKKVGQFGTGDFTIAFGMKNISTHDDTELDIIGSQTMQGHGNFFSLRLVGRQAIFFHVDENSKGRHYVKTQTARLSAMPNRVWVHVAAVRKGRTIQIYIDGVPSAKATSKTGIANIKNDTDVKLGHSRRGTPTAQYEDLRIYNRALSTAEINALIPPLNRPLKEGEIELQATDGATVILKEDVADLSLLSRNFERLRVGKHTGATIFRRENFSGTRQKCYADLPDMKLSKIESFPNAIRIWSAVGDPFTGKWIIKAPNGEFLSQENSVLGTAPRRSFKELFRFHYNLRHGQLQLLPGAGRVGALHKLSATTENTPLFVEELENRSDEFFITNDEQDRWLELGEDGTFNWTLKEENRALFTRVAKRAVDDDQVGELATGEVALYKNRAYHGQAWILSDTEKDTSGNYTRFGDFEDLNDQTSSIRLGPNTGVTLFKHFNNKTTEGKRETEIEDIVENAPDLSNMQIGDESLSSIRIFRTISPEDVFTSFSTKLSQDYRMVDDKLQEFSSYRTILKFEPGAGEIELSATDLTEIEVEGETYEVDEKRSVKLKPNELNFIMITSEADGLNTPGLKIRTSDMEINERVVIFPNEEAHQQIASLEDGALWNAKDAKGNLIVDRKAHSKEEVASVQSTIKRVMGTVSYAEDQSGRRGTPSNPASKPIRDVARPIPVNIPRPVLRRAGAINLQAAVQGSTGQTAEQTATVSTNSRVQLSNRVVSGAIIDKPWVLELPTKKQDNLQQIRALSAVDGNATSSRANSAANTIIQEVEISQDEFAKLLGQAIPEETAPSQPPENLPPGVSLIRIGNPFKKIGRAIKKATSVVIGVVKDVVNVIVRTAQGVFKFIVDTVEKVAEFVESVVEKVVKAIKQFIEFLQFLFNWGDILKTQRYLVGAVNAGLDYGGQLAEDAKPHVSAFVSDLQGTVEDGMNSLVKKLGGEPSAVKKGKVKMPEALDWLLSKILGGSKRTKSGDDSNGAPTGDSPLEEFVRHAIEALEAIAGSGLRAIEGVSESITTLLKNPLKPERALIVILEALRDVIIQLLDGAENIALGLLEVVGIALDLFKGLLNQEIRIPFISDLFKLLGAGKLTILNLSTLLLAVPVTIIHKLVYNERPFKDVPPLKLSTQKDVGQAANLSQQPPQQLLSVQQAEPSEATIQRAIRVTTGLGITSLVANFANGLLNMYLNLPPESADEAQEKSLFNGALELMSWVGDIFIWLPSIPGLLTEGKARFTAVSVEERVLWVYRTFTLALDLGFTMAGWMQPPADRNTQTMPRATVFTIGLSSALGVIDFVIGTVFVARTIPKDQQALHFVHQMLFPLPHILSPLRLDSSGVGSLVLMLVDFTTATATTVTGFTALGDNFSHIREGVRDAFVPQDA